jgi:hypothetical protein
MPLTGFEVIKKVAPRFGSASMAFAWYRSEPLAGFAGQTAMQLVQAGRVGDVLGYIDAVDAGGHAYAKQPGAFSPLVEMDAEPIYTPIEKTGERPYWRDG